MKGATPVVVIVVAMAALAGCAGRTVNVGYPESAVHRALLGSVPPQRVVIAPVGDRRADKSRIGMSPKDGKPLVTARPVTDIVQEALATEVGKNGHDVVAGPGDIVVAADVEEFWLDAVGKSANTQYVGRVAIAVVIVDGRTSDRLMTRRYVGIKRSTGEADAGGRWRQVMDTALARTIHDLATDPDVAATISRVPR